MLLHHMVGVKVAPATYVDDRTELYETKNASLAFVMNDVVMMYLIMVVMVFTFKTSSCLP